MLLLQLKDGISAQSRDVAEDESSQSYQYLVSKPSPSPGPTLSDHPSDNEDNYNDPFCGSIDIYRQPN